MNDIIKECNQRIYDDWRINHRPLICYALDKNYLSDELWEWAQNVQNYINIPQLDSDSLKYPLLMMVLWARFFYEKSDGREVWNILPDKIFNKKIEKFINKNNIFKPILEKVKNNYFRFLRTQCWVLSTREAGTTSEIIKNNILLSNIISRKKYSHEFDIIDWLNEEYPDASLYLKYIVKNYKDYVILSTKALCDGVGKGLLCQDDYEENPWLLRLKEDSKKNGEAYDFEWIFEPNPSFNCIRLRVKNRKARRLYFYKNEKVHPRNLTNNALSLKDILGIYNIDELKKGIPFHYGSYVPSIDLTKPLLFRGVDLSLIETPNEKIPFGREVIYVYIPNSEKFNYNHLFLSHGGKEIIIDEKNVKVPRHQLNFLGDIYEVDFIVDHSAYLSLKSKEEWDREIYLFSENFGKIPKILKEDEEYDKEELKAKSVNGEFVLVDCGANFRLEGIPMNVCTINWTLNKPNGEKTVWKTYLQNQKPCFYFTTHISGIYELTCFDDKCNKLASRRFIYIQEFDKLDKKLLLNKCNKELGFRLYEVNINKEAIQLYLARGIGEGDFFVNSKANNYLGNLDIKNYYTPDDLLTNWEIEYDFSCLVNNRRTFDFGNLKFTGTKEGLEVTQSILAIISDVEKLMEESDLIYACFNNTDYAQNIYQYFDYGSNVVLKYNDEVIFSYTNTPCKSYLGRFMMNSGPGYVLWNGFCNQESLSVIVGQEEIELPRLENKEHLYSCNYRNSEIFIDGKKVDTPFNRTLDLKYEFRDDGTWILTNKGEEEVRNKSLLNPDHYEYCKELLDHNYGYRDDRLIEFSERVDRMLNIGDRKKIQNCMDVISDCCNQYIERMYFLSDAWQAKGNYIINIMDNICNEEKSGVRSILELALSCRLHRFMSLENDCNCIHLPLDNPNPCFLELLNLLFKHRDKTRRPWFIVLSIIDYCIIYKSDLQNN